LLQSAPTDVQREVLGRLNGGVALSR
jgi:hypothetical protein